MGWRRYIAYGPQVFTGRVNREFRSEAFAQQTSAAALGPAVGTGQALSLGEAREGLTRERREGVRAGR